MPRGEAPISNPITDRTNRFMRYTELKGKLFTKAHELATLRGVPIAVVCSGLDGEGEPEFWPSKMEAMAVASQIRANNAADQADDAARQLETQSSRLDKAREGGIVAELEAWDRELNEMSEEALRELLRSIEDSLEVAKGRIWNLQPQHDGEADDAGLVLDDTDLVELLAEFSVTGDAGVYGDAAPVDLDEIMGENFVAGENASHGVHVQQPPGDADDAEWMQELLRDLKEKPAPYIDGIEYINASGHVMERDAYDFIQYDLGIPPPSLEPESLDHGEPLQLWSSDESSSPQSAPPSPKCVLDA